MSPRVIILLYVAFVLTLFFVGDLSFHVYTSLAVLAFAFWAVPWRKMRSGIIPISLLLLFTFAGNLFFHPGKILYDRGLLSISEEGLRLAAIRTLRIFSMIYAAKALTSLVSVDGMMEAMEGLTRPLERIGVPVSDFFSVAGLTLKAFPALTAHVLKEYREHMAGTEIRGFRPRVKYAASLLMPIFVKSIRSPEGFFVSPGAPDTEGK